MLVVMAVPSCDVRNTCYIRIAGYRYSANMHDLQCIGDVIIIIIIIELYLCMCSFVLLQSRGHFFSPFLAFAATRRDLVRYRSNALDEDP